MTKIRMTASTPDQIIARDLLDKALPAEVTMADVEIVEFTDLTLTAFTFFVAGFKPAITLTFRDSPSFGETLAAIRAVSASLRLEAWVPGGKPH